MRLGYICYTSGSEQARLALYHGDPSLVFIFQDMRFTQFPPMISVGPPMLATRPFHLTALRNGDIAGFCRGEFANGGISFTECTGTFEGISAYKLEQETLHAKQIPPTNIVLLSQKWHGYQLEVGKKGAQDWDVEYWDERGIYTKRWHGQRRVTGWSTRYSGSSSECSAALAAVISGPQTGKTGWLLMGDDAGLQIGGAYGEVTGAMWVPSLDDFSGKLSDFNSRGYIGVPPISVMPELEKEEEKGQP